MSGRDDSETFGDAPASPSPAPRATLGGDLSFKPPPRPGSSLRRSRKSAAELASPVPPLPRNDIGMSVTTEQVSRSSSRSSRRSASESEGSDDGLVASGTARAPIASPTKPARPAARGSLSLSTPLRAALGESAANGGSASGAPQGPTPRQTDRRARNAVAPAGHGDVGLLNELQENLVKEIRRLQGLLWERDSELKSLRETHDTLNANLENLKEENDKVKVARDEAEQEAQTWKTQSLQLIQNEDKLKQENWDLNVAHQHLESEVTERDAALKKVEAERNRLVKDLGKVRDLAESQRVQLEEGGEELTKLRTLRETETAVARKEKAALTREMSDVKDKLTQAMLEKTRAAERADISRSQSRSILASGSLSGLADQADEDDLTAESAAAARRRVAEAGVPVSPGGSTLDEHEASAHLSPLGNKLARDTDMADLRAKLAQAHKRSGKELLEKRKLRNANAELRALLQRAGVEAPEASDVESSDASEEEEDAHWIDEAGKSAGKRAAKARPGLPKSSTRPNIANRFGLGSRAGRRNSKEFHDDDDDSMALAASGEDVEESLDSARRASLDGIDPAYADVTKANFASPSAARSARRTRRRDTVRPNDADGRSPLSRTVTLPGDEDDEDESASSTGHGTWGRTSGRRSAAAGARSRPGSAVIQAGTLGNELEGLTGAPDDELARENAFASSGTYTGSALDLSRELQGEASLHDADMQTQQPQLDDKVMQTDTLPDTLTPLLQQRDAAHAAAVSAHVKAIAQLGEAHAAALEEREAQHQTAMAEREAKHARILGDKSNTHAAALETREAEHEKVLADKDAKHSATLAAALAQQTKTHEAAVAEARSRHTKSLAEEVAKGAAAVAAAEAMHKKHVSDHLAAHQRAIERRDKQHADVLERQARQHAALLADKETSNAAALEDMQMSNDAFIRDLENAFNQTLREREALIKHSREEIEALRTRLSALETELERLRSASKAAEAAAAAAAASRVALEREAERLKDELEEARATIASNEHEDKFEDADEVPVSSSPRPRNVGLGIDENKATVAAVGGAMAGVAAAAAAALAPPMDRSVTRSTSSEVNSPPTPRDVEEAGIRKIVLADLKDSGCQTDDDVWTRFQEAHRGTAPVRPPAPSTDSVLIVGAAVATAAAAAGKPLRDSVSTFGGHRDGTLRPESPGPTMYTVSSLTRQQAAGSLRRPSVESQLSGLRVETETTTDHSKPPVMEVPPPPSMPPPAGLPTLVRRTSKQRTSTDLAPPRPISPPPPELLAMAQRRSSTLQVPAPVEPGTRSLGRASGTSMPPPVSYPGNAGAGRPKPSMSNARTRTISNEIVAGNAQRGGDAASIRSQLQSVSSRRSDRPPVSYNAHLRATSAASFASDATSDLSRRMSYASSRASDFAPPGGNMLSTPGASTDPNVIHAITQTMIGEYLHKYTRKTMGRAGHSEKRHQRYFWLHPYTKMLYWTIADPGAQGVREGTSKSAVIEDVRVVEDSNNSPPGLYHLSIIVRTPARDMKLTAPNKERHDMWLSALGYLVSRSPPQGNGSASEAIMAEASGLTEPASAGRQRTRTAGSTASRFLSPARSLASVARRNRSTDTFATNLDATPRQRGGSVGPASALNPSLNKRRDTAAHEYLNLWESRRSGLASPGPTSPRSIGTASRLSTRSDYGMPLDDYEHVTRPVDPRLQTAEQMLEEDEPEGFDGLENVRACCNGAHDVGDLAHKKYISQQQGSTSKRRGSIRSRHSRAGSNGSSASQLKQLRAAVKAGTAARPTSPPPQLGIMNLNAPRERDSKTSDTARSSTSDWFSPAEDLASLHGPASGRTSAQGMASSSTTATGGTRQAKSSSERSPMPPTTPTFGERRSAILKSRQSAA